MVYSDLSRSQFLSFSIILFLHFQKLLKKFFEPLHTNNPLPPIQSKIFHNLEKYIKQFDFVPGFTVYIEICARSCEIILWKSILLKTDIVQSLPKLIMNQPSLSFTTLSSKIKTFDFISQQKKPIENCAQIIRIPPCIRTLNRLVSEPKRERSYSPIPHFFHVTCLILNMDRYFGHFSIKSLQHALKFQIVVSNSITHILPASQNNISVIRYT